MRYYRLGNWAISFNEETKMFVFSLDYLTEKVIIDLKNSLFGILSDSYNLYIDSFASMTDIFFKDGECIFQDSDLVALATFKTCTKSIYVGEFNIDYISSPISEKLILRNKLFGFGIDGRGASYLYYDGKIYDIPIFRILGALFEYLIPLRSDNLLRQIQEMTTLSSGT